MTFPLLLSLALMFMFMNPLHARDHHDKVSTQLLESICQTTRDPSFCLRTLSPHLLKATNLRRLAKFTIDKATSHAVATEKKIKSAIETTKDSRTKKGYISCSKDYADAISALKDASRDIVRGHFGDVKNNAQNAIEEARSCERRKPRNDDSVWLHEGNKNLDHHSGIIVTIANKLQEQQNKENNPLISPTPSPY